MTMRRCWGRGAYAWMGMVKGGQAMVVSSSRASRVESAKARRETTVGVTLSTLCGAACGGFFRIYALPKDESHWNIIRATKALRALPPSLLSPWYHALPALVPCLGACACSRLLHLRFEIEIGNRPLLSASRSTHTHTPRFSNAKISRG